MNQYVPIAGISDHDIILTNFYTKALLQESTNSKCKVRSYISGILQI